MRIRNGVWCKRRSHEEHEYNNSKQNTVMVRNREENTTTLIIAMCGYPNIKVSRHIYKVVRKILKNEVVKRFSKQHNTKELYYSWWVGA